jgi:signal transduction histidine kinase
MKTTYSRTFLTATVVLLLSLLMVGIFLRALLDDYLTDSAFARLEKDARVISELTVAYYTEDSVTSMDFLINLDIAGQVSEADTVICDQNGRIILCSENPLGCQHQGLMVGEEYLNRVLSGNGTMDTGVIQGLYEDSRFVYSMPVRLSNGKLLGIVMVSQSVDETKAVLHKMTDLFIILSIFVVAVSVPVIGYFVNRQSKPLRQMAKTARDFGHGDLDARVEISSNYTQEVGELALAFNNMASSLQKSEYQRQEFVANVSHELKTPMTTIGGYIDGILDGTIPPEKSRHYMRIVSDETKRLSRLVRSMLDISQLQTEAGIPEEKKSRFDLEEAAGQVLITFEQKITAKGVNVEVDMPEHPVFTFANADYVTQVIYNLLDNAVKFCPTGGTLGLRIREGGSKAYISIYNDGETIPPEELPLVFDRFHKIDKSRSQNRDGWGLGLYIVKTIVCSHGENISVSSKDGKTEFTFTMPLVN